MASTSCRSELSADLFEEQIRDSNARHETPDFGLAMSGIKQACSTSPERQSLSSASTSHSPARSRSRSSSGSSILCPPKKPKKKVPDIVAACFTHYKYSKRGREAKCRQCGTIVKDGVAGTSNWVRHIQRQNHAKMRERYGEFLKNGSNSDKDSGSKNLSCFGFKFESPYPDNHPTQKAIRQAVMDLIVDCSLPVALVEQVAFRRLLETCNRRYVHGSRRGLMLEIEKKYNNAVKLLVARLREVNHVTVTVDIWTDRRMRSFLGMTAHYIMNSILTSSLLCCQRITGSHTGEHIKETYDNVLSEFDLLDKVGYVISDNAANMLKAFKTTMPGSDEVRCEEELSDEDSGDEWEDSVEWDGTSSAATHLRCFAHTLQLVVRDGLKASKGVNSLLGKCCKLASLLHTSAKFKDAFEAKFDNHGIPQINSTRWNSLYLHIAAISRLPQDTLSVVLAETDHTNLNLTFREAGLMEEFVKLLEPFYEATQLTQGEKVVTLSYVLPCVLQLSVHLAQFKPGSVMRPMAAALKTSLDLRFGGLLSIITKDPIDENKPFSDPEYLMATLLDRNWSIEVIEHYTKEEDLTIVKTKVKDIMVDELKDLSRTEVAPTTETQRILDDGDDTSHRMFAAFKQRKRSSGVGHHDVDSEIATLFSMGAARVNSVAY